MAAFHFMSTTRHSPFQIDFCGTRSSVQVGVPERTGSRSSVHRQISSVKSLPCHVEYSRKANQTNSHGNFCGKRSALASIGDIVNVPTHAEQWHEGAVLAIIFIFCKASSRHCVNACVRHHNRDREGVLAITLILIKASLRNYVNTGVRHHTMDMDECSP